jgi:hypothetical protein
MKTNGNGHSTSLKPVEIIAGKTIAHSFTWSKVRRRKLAARATFGAVVVTPMTAIQAGEIFDVPVTEIAAELKKLGVELRIPTATATAMPTATASRCPRGMSSRASSNRNS